jgi:hypothetical protein
MSRKAPEHGPRPEFKNEAGIAATMARFNMDETQASRYLDGAWADWHKVEDEHQREAEGKARSQRYNGVTAKMSQIPPELNARRVVGEYNDGRKGDRVDVDLDALLRLLYPR